MKNEKLNGISQVLENEGSVKQLNAKDGTMELSEENLKEVAGGAPTVPNIDKHGRPTRRTGPVRDIIKK